MQGIEDINTLVTSIQFTMSPHILSAQLKPIQPLDFISGDLDKQGIKEVITQTIIG